MRSAWRTLEPTVIDRMVREIVDEHCKFTNFIGKIHKIFGTSSPNWLVKITKRNYTKDTKLFDQIFTKLFGVSHQTIGEFYQTFLQCV
jgi:hypothetical protein